MTRVTIALAIPIGILSLCFLASGCGGGATTEPTVKLKPATLEQAQDSGSKGPDTPVSSGGKGPGNIVGQILFDGSPPSLSPLVAKGAVVRDPEVCSANPVPNEGIVVGENGGLANVFIFLDSAPKGYKPEGELPNVTLDQKGCRFRPHALLAQVGQKINIINSDNASHNTNISFVRNKIFNGTINPNDNTGVMLEPTKAEKLPVKTVCDVHAWMSCYVFVLDHPFAAVTDENGQFEIKNLPAGKHTFRVWHESADFLERSLSVDVKAGEDAKVDLKYNISKFPKL
ncbi:MAG TPA: hypothetical protein VMM56_04255 [Planctomycetaceae bacterium]|nr:hypothetical protein [Planctomycetaceae bacterium]